MDDDERLYHVVVNDEEQYSIWDATRPLPSGWTAVGDPAAKAACLETIEGLWTDLRPRSVREAHARHTTA
ncbi:MAG: MbtH family protein [Saccharothrix sp.]|nr:MbtH family protein [Saccharothrix sp.]